MPGSIRSEYENAEWLYTKESVKMKDKTRECVLYSCFRKSDRQYVLSFIENGLLFSVSLNSSNDFNRKTELQTLCLIKLTKKNDWFNILNIRGESMSKKTVVVMPDTQIILEKMGEQIKMARLRRNLSTELVAERAGISRATLWAVEKGTPTVAVGTYAAVLHALGGMDKDLELVAQDDEFGRRIQDMNLVTPKRAKRK